MSLPSDSLRCTSCHLSQTWRYSCIAVVDIPPVIWDTQRRLSRPSATDVSRVSLRLTRHDRAGTSCWIDCPCSHRSVQNLVLVPFPMTVYVETAKKACTSRETAIGRLDHARCSSACLSHSYFVWRAMSVRWRSGMPRPPNSLGAAYSRPSNHAFAPNGAHFPGLEESPTNCVNFLPGPRR